MTKNFLWLNFFLWFNFWVFRFLLIVTKLKNSNCDKTQKLKLWPNSKTETETKHKNFKCDEIPKTKFVTKLTKKKLWQNSTQLVTKLKNSYCDKTWKLKLWQKHLDTLTTDHSQGSFSQFLRCFFFSFKIPDLAHRPSLAPIVAENRR